LYQSGTSWYPLLMLLNVGARQPASIIRSSETERPSLSVCDSSLRNGVRKVSIGKIVKSIYCAILGGVLIGFIVAQAFSGTAARAQGARAVVIRSPFPLAEFAELLQGLYARPVTYEDALLVWRGDQEDIRTTGKTRLKTRVFAVPDGLNPAQAPRLDAALVKRALEAYHQQNDGPRFEVRESKMGFHIIPALVASENGQLGPSANILGSVITVPRAKRTPTEHFAALCAALTVSTGVTVRFDFALSIRPLELVFLPNGNMPPRGILTDAELESQRFEWGASGISAQDAIISLIEPSSTTLSWELRCLAGEGRQDRTCFLNIGVITLRHVLPDGSIALGAPLLYDRCSKCAKPGQPPQ
jgi:hypothetical protein